MTAWLVLTAVLFLMVVEAAVSRRHERGLRALGAVAPDDPAYEAMRWVYPGAFVAMAIEGAFLASTSRFAVIAGVVLFATAKLLKVWAIRTLGERWTFRVFVLPDAPLVTGGPYRLMRHPNYLAVLGELAGMALMVDARVTGPIALVTFAYLLRVRIASEERALGIR